MQQIGTITSNHGYDALDPDTYTAQRLKHASPEHLHITTHRFFIGPIPEGWLNANRKSWYKRRLLLSDYSSRRATFTAVGGDVHRRSLTGLEGPSTAARLALGFQQPADAQAGEDGREASETEDEDAEIEARPIEPIATNASDLPQILGIADEDDVRQPKLLSVPSDTGIRPLKGILHPSSLVAERPGQRSKSPVPPSFLTAKERFLPPQGNKKESVTKETHPEAERDGEDGASDMRPSISNRDDSNPSPSRNGNTSPYPGPTSSMTALLPQSEPNTKSVAKSRKSLLPYEPAPVADDEPYTTNLGRVHTGVRFKVTEGVANQQERIARRVDSAQQRARQKARFRRDTLQEGAIAKMEKMLVRVDMTLQQLPNDFDENDSLKTETRVLEKWREFMVVARRSHKDDADFRLQMYKSRVIPEIESDTAKKKPTREIMLNSKTAKVNLYSSLDKTVVVWHPYKKGTRIIIMRPRSIAHSVEWYTFLRDALGWARPSSLQVNVPDLSVSLRLEKPFAGLEAIRGASGNIDEDTALAKTMAEEQAVAGKIIQQCTEMLEKDREWSSVLETWSKTQKMGLAWKRYDRLEWIHGVNEQKMYGSMAMEKSYDLELRPKQHYPTSTYGKKGKLHEEPTPIEGFLIRLTSQKGLHQRLGKAFFKRLYFSTQNHLLVFNRPAKVTPPHPPRLPTTTGPNIPSSSEIVEQSPTMYEIDPYPVIDGGVTWLSSGNKGYVQMHDRNAFEESQRNMNNLSECDGFINMCHIVRVREMRWGAAPMDDHLDAGSGSDVEFHQEVPNTRQEDGETKKIDDDRIFELVLENGLVMRLQAYNQETRDEWIKRLRMLVKYWNLRTRADMDLFKSVRKSNLENLNIDEEMEAIIGQFARKWEVSHSEASPQLHNMCGISCCRPITISGLLYRKPRRHSTFVRCGVILTGGQLLIFNASMRKLTGEQVKHVHQERQQAIDLRDCYVYSGLITQDDLLYQNQTFDSNHPGMHSLPRVYLDDGWTSSDEDTMTCFVVWHALRKSYFKAIVGEKEDGGTRQKLRQVSRLGVPGRSVVFKCRSRAERDHWVMSVGAEIDRLQQQQDEEVRVDGGEKK